MAPANGDQGRVQVSSSNTPPRNHSFTPTHACGTAGIIGGQAACYAPPRAAASRSPAAAFVSFAALTDDVIIVGLLLTHLPLKLFPLFLIVSNAGWWSAVHIFSRQQGQGREQPKRRTA